MQQSIPNIEDLFFAARELKNPEARSAFLDEACSDLEVRRRVEVLLAVDTEANDFLRAPASMPTVTEAHEPRSGVEEPGTVIGPYKLMEVIGEGGMGVVYVAEQHEPVRRRVALKVIKPGMDSRQVVARFKAERQALAMMDHPNIAKVHDAGMTPSGRPYFVMELLRGLPITDYCDREELSIPERLELFVLVCRAVQHAHQKGVIHRDLKPSNILVTLHDGVPVPKVIDFGVAKATGQALTDKTVYTGFHQFVGTPLYTSPEQADLAGSDVDTRSDIYSLGVLLYELLTGTTPFDAETLRRAAFDEMRRILREEEPPRPSTRLSTLGDRLTTVSARRKADPRRLGSAMKGELDWVVMKALEKDRRRRYETASDFAADVMNYLIDRPVEACPPSAGYRFAKFARRNRTALVTGILIALALAGGTGVSVWQAIEATKARRLAEVRSAQARRAVDEMYTQVAEKWLSQQPGLTPVQQQFLEKALALYTDFADERADDPKALLEAARARMKVAVIHYDLGRLDLAEAASQQMLRQLEALAERYPEEGECRQELATRLYNVSGLRIDQGRLNEAEALVSRAVRIAEGLVRQAPKNQVYRCDLGQFLQQRAQVLDLLGRLDEAEAAARRSRALFEEHRVAGFTGPECRIRFAVCEMALGLILENRKKYAEAEAAHVRSLRLREELVADDPGDPNRKHQLCVPLINLANTQTSAGRVEEAIRTRRRAVQGLETLVGRYPDRPEYAHHLAQCLENLFGSLRVIGRPREAEEVGRRGVELSERLVRDHPGVPAYRERTVRLLVRLADLHSIPPEPEFDEPATALGFARRAIELEPSDGMALQSLGWAKYRAGDLRGCIATLPERDLINGAFLAMAHWRLGDKARARACYDRAAEWLEGYESHWNPGVYPSAAMLRQVQAEAASRLGITQGGGPS